MQIELKCPEGATQVNLDRLRTMDPVKVREGTPAQLEVTDEQYNEILSLYGTVVTVTVQGG